MGVKVQPFVISYLWESDALSVKRDTITRYKAFEIIKKKEDEKKRQLGNLNLFDGGRWGGGGSWA